jgi:hypothetical protein
MKALWKSFVVLLVAGAATSFAAPTSAARKAEEGTIQGSVMGPRGHLVSGARVRIRRDSGRRGKIVRTGSKGYFESNHMPGRFAIRAHKRGVGHSSTMHVYLASGQTINLPSIYIYPHRRVRHLHGFILGVGRPRESKAAPIAAVPNAPAQSPAPVQPPAQQPQQSGSPKNPVSAPPVLKTPGAVRGK